MKVAHRVSKFTIPLTDPSQKFIVERKTFFSVQSEVGNSNASGTGSVRVNALGLVSILQ